MKFSFLVFSSYTVGDQLPNELHDDIMYTDCQRDLFKNLLDIEIPDKYVSELKIDVPCPNFDRGISSGVVGFGQKWDADLDGDIGKFRIVYLQITVRS